MEFVMMETEHVTGVPESLGGSGDPSPVTAYGVYMGMKASAKYKWGSDNLLNKKIVVQGVGNVGENLVKYLTEERAQIMIHDINKERLDSISKQYGAEIVNYDNIYDIDMDIYAPCALGATVNPDSLNKLSCEI